MRIVGPETVHRRRPGVEDGVARLVTAKTQPSRITRTTGPWIRFWWLVPPVMCPSARGRIVARLPSYPHHRTRMSGNFRWSVNHETDCCLARAYTTDRFGASRSRTGRRAKRSKPASARRSTTRSCRQSRPAVGGARGAIAGDARDELGTATSRSSSATSSDFSLTDVVPDRRQRLTRPPVALFDL